MINKVSFPPVFMSLQQQPDMPDAGSLQQPQQESAMPPQPPPPPPAQQYGGGVYYASMPPPPPPFYWANPGSYFPGVAAPQVAMPPAQFDRVSHVEQQVDLLHKFLQQQQSLMEVLVSMMAVKNKLADQGVIFGGGIPQKSSDSKAAESSSTSKEETSKLQPPAALPKQCSPHPQSAARPFTIQRRAAV